MRITNLQKIYRICSDSLLNLSYGKAPHIESTYEREFFIIRFFKNKPYNKRGITSIINVLDNVVFIDPKYNTKYRGECFIKDITKKFQNAGILYKLEAPPKKII